VCGRYQITVPFRRLVELYGLVAEECDSGLRFPAFNVGPTHRVPVVLQSEEGVELRAMRWGFPPLWVAHEGKDPWKGRPLINARSEAALQKRTWSTPLRRQRCLLPCTGFYEWKKQDKRRLPVWFKPTRTDVLSMAGIWSEFEREGEIIGCVSILTTAANARVAPVHDRMPVFVPASERQRWMGELNVEEVEGFLRAAPEGILSLHPVSTELGKMSAQGPEVLDPDWSLDLLKG
jgi:putative SOS response-associated peptidase YedK